MKTKSVGYSLPDCDSEDRGLPISTEGAVEVKTTEEENLANKIADLTSHIAYLEDGLNILHGLILLAIRKPPNESRNSN